MVNGALDGVDAGFLGADGACIMRLASRRAVR